jgi:SAM-dependent methyltransferase
LPLKQENFDICLALNVIDMMPAPEDLPQIQKKLLKPGGIAIQSCPYIWHAQVSEHLREILPPEIKNSSAAVEQLYRNAGFQILEKMEHVPWLFFKHVRQLEIYSVHLFYSQNGV